LHPLESTAFLRRTPVADSCTAAKNHFALHDALGLSAMAGETLADVRTGKNGRHALVGLLRQSVFGRLAGYEDVNDDAVRGAGITAVASAA
jgi:hypothetical protein